MICIDLLDLLREKADEALKKSRLTKSLMGKVETGEVKGSSTVS
jgi:hypothetical protein